MSAQAVPPTRRATEAAGAVDRRTPLGRAIVAQALLEVRLLVRSGESLLLTLVIPLGVLVFLSLVDVVPTGDGPAVDLLVPGVLAISVVATGLVAVAIQTAFERKYGVLKRLGGTPLPRWGFLAAKGLATGVVLLVQTVLVVAIATTALGWQPQGGAVAAPLAILVGAVTSTALGLLLAGTVRAEATLALSNGLFLVLLVISGVTFDAGVLPTVLAEVGALLPMGALATVLRAAFAGDGLAVVPLLVLGGWGAAATALATRTFRWDP